MTDTRRLSLAKQILASDSTNVVALTELGIHHAASYHWYANFVAAKQPFGGGLEAKARREFNKAYRYLDKALVYQPEAVQTYRELIRLLIQATALDEAADVAERLTNQRSDLPDGWALRGLVAELQKQPERAAYFFERAVSNMSGLEKEEFGSSRLFLRHDQRIRRDSMPSAFDEAYWFERDPLYLTGDNERLTDHYARMIYTDLQYGTADVDGWNTERGQIIMRYGFPLADFTLTGSISRFNVIDYGDFDFVFEDQTRGGHFTLYSPKAGSGSSWNLDYVIRAGEMEIALPERFRFSEMPRTPVETSVVRFRGSDRKTDLYIQYAIPIEHAGRPGLNADPRSEIAGFVTLPEGGVHKTVRTQVSDNAVSMGLRPFAVGVLAFELAPGTYGMSVEYLNFDRSAYGARRDTIKIRGWSPTNLELSDVIVASSVDAASELETSSPGSIRRHGYVITPDPLHHVQQGGDAIIYFEVYGLTPGTNSSASYQIDARVEPRQSGGFLRSLFSVFGGNQPRTVTTSFKAGSNSSDDHRWFAVDLSVLEPADYILTVGITDDAQRRNDSKSVSFTITE